MKAHEQEVAGLELDTGPEPQSTPVPHTVTSSLEQSSQVGQVSHGNLLQGLSPWAVLP